LISASELTQSSKYFFLTIILVPTQSEQKLNFRAISIKSSKISNLLIKFLNLSNGTHFKTQCIPSMRWVEQS
jgi:hypothetical protein